ncbi:hypothetical protein A9C19_16745 [Bacillus weihaiensis]|uniref:Uncharacterized protein n=1 Tax=Bacillus weihaiensis TaxID=1547283 RepID=A0A1L3MV68_9BACI|nr:hypothetical protein A9C19_16745 [Bacillus weihaiensis]
MGQNLIIFLNDERLSFDTMLLINMLGWKNKYVSFHYSYLLSAGKNELLFPREEEEPLRLRL